MAFYCTGLSDDQLRQAREEYRQHPGLQDIAENITDELARREDYRARQETR